MIPKGGRQRSSRSGVVVAILYGLLCGPLTGSLGWAAQTNLIDNAPLALCLTILGGTVVLSAALYSLKRVRPLLVSAMSLLGGTGIILSSLCPWVEKGMCDFGAVLIMSAGPFLACCVGLCAGLVVWGRSVQWMRLW